MKPMFEENEIHTLRVIAGLCARRDFERDVEHKQELLDCIAMLVRPWADEVDEL